MKIKLQFFGAARNVTGSCFLVETNGRRLLIDCGLYQERKLRYRNWDNFPVPADSIDAVLLTHAHLDHCGRIPKLVKEGFNGPIYTTTATAEITGIVMLDSAHIQEEDIKYKQKRHQRENRKSPHPYEPLYNTKDAQAAIELLSPVEYRNPLSLGEGLDAEFYEAGHIFGSSFIELRVKQNREQRRMLFSGDVGRENLPILKDPARFTAADYIVVESTYGDRLHETAKSIPDALEKVVNDTCKRGGNIIVPSFAIERSQEMLYHMNTLLQADRIPRIPVYLDSPMAIKVTEVFMRHPELFDAEMAALLRKGQDPCDFPGLTMTRTVEESKAIKDAESPKMIIAGSGMCAGGRVKHHLKDSISDPDSTVLFVGYQAVGTLGRVILEGTNPVRIHGESFPVKALIEQIHGFSAHADLNELTDWLSSIENQPRKAFVIHGEEQPARKFSEQIESRYGWNTVVPEYGDEYLLE